MPNDTINNTPRGGSNLNLGPAAISLARYASTLALGILGTLFYQGNLVSLREYNTSSLLRTTAFEVVTQTGSTATGGLKSGTPGNYQAITQVSPFSAATAASNGVQTASGVLAWTMIDPIAVPVPSSYITCSIANATVRGTGGTIVVPRTLLATGATIYRSTGAHIIGPTETFRCSINPAPTAATNIKVLQTYRQSRVAD